MHGRKAGKRVLAVGLGNIGNEYAKTRHNLGFMAIDAIREKYGFPDWKERPKYLFSKSKIGGRDVMLVKPKTYMNLSGGAVLAAATACKIPPDGTVVIHDDLDLAPARVKIKLGGGNAGHNGLRDIDAKIGRGYWRIRIGIGHPRDSAPAMDVADYVLARPPKDEAVALAAAIEKIADRFEAVAGGDFSMPL